MGLFSAIKRQLLKVIKWDDPSTNCIVYKVPMEDRDEIMNGCQLIVSESQVAMLVTGGQIADVYGAGTHELTTKNMPIITKLASWKYGFDSPFKADVYYVNTKQFIDQNWGTSSRVPMRDKDFGLIRIGARGKYSFKVKDAPTFMREIFGTNREYTTEALATYFKSIIVTGFADTLGTANIPALDLAAKYLELAEDMKKTLLPQFDRIGIEIPNINVEGITLPDEVEKAMDQRAAVGAIGNQMGNFTQYQAAQAIRDVANNPNAGAGMAGMGVGMGAGVAMGQAMGKAFSDSFQAKTPETQATAQGGVCPKCGQPVSANAKFCSNCGSPIEATKFCANCGAKLAPNAKFCPNCGKQQ
jgi:membrane protease subunit (stomatin/prohibitin family)